jgi:hypothetical protein
MLFAVQHIGDLFLGQDYYFVIVINFWRMNSVHDIACY